MTYCFDIGGSKVVAAKVDELGQVAVLARQPTPAHDRSAFHDTLAKLCPAGSEPIGISIAGVIDPLNGRLTSANIPCISGTCLAQDLSQLLNRKVILINDADAFALAEAHWGAARKHATVMAVILGTGVGGAIVLNGRLHVGHGGLAGEWGHGPFQALRTGQQLPVLTCLCGLQGCIDTLGGARGLERIYQHMYGHERDSVSIVADWQSGHQEASSVIDVWLDIVGGSLAAAINMVGPSIVPVGGGLANSAALIAALDQEVCSRSLSTCKTLLYPAVSGPEQGLVGAAIRVKDADSRAPS